MNTNRTYRRGCAALFLILTLTACNNLAGPGTDTLSGETIPQGMGMARINLGGSEARTTVPGITGYYFTLDFTAPGKADVNETLTGSTTLTVPLEPAVWTLEVKGYTNSTKTDLKVTGNASVSVIAGRESSFNVYLAAEFGSGGTGILSYSISFPAAARAWFALYPIDDTPGTSREIAMSSLGGTASATLSLPEGSYRAVIDLYDGTANEAAVWTGAVHIGDGSTTALTHTFTTAGFAACDPVIGTGEATLAAKLDAALASPEGSYTITLDGTETDITTFTPKTLNVTEGKDITVTIRGKGQTVQLGSPGRLFTLGANTGSSLRLVLQDVTLRGISSNNDSLVRVESGGTLEMHTGSLITGNTTASYGGGVYVNGGTFIMSGGAVSGNSVSYFSSGYFGGGGGVYVNGGTFIMSGGAVSGNSIDYYFEGGGVAVSGTNATFTMSGGAVSGNSGPRRGGGVNVSWGGTFTMSGGVVSGNSASSNGGGVAVHSYGADSGATFIMSGGTVSGNTAYAQTAYGGGVYVSDTNSIFTMSGGTVSGNTASTYSSGYGAFGGGVAVVSGGTFTMSSGAVSGNILSATGSYSWGREVLIYGSGIFKMSGDAWPEKVFLEYYNSGYPSITITGPLSGGIVPIDLKITSYEPLTGWVNKPVLALDSSYSSGNLASLKDYFTLGNTKMTNSPYTETPIPAEYTIGNDGKLEGPPPPPISGITYSGTWTLQSDGRYKSPTISHSSTTKARVSFISTVADADIMIQLDVSSESGYDYAFISTLDNASTTSASGYYTGSRISGTASVTITIPVPTAGSHFIEIGYQKDGSQTSGSDCAWFKIVEPPPPPSSGISGITYNSVSGGTWTLQSDGRRKSPSISHNGTTKTRVSFTSTEADAFIVVQLEVSSEAGYDYAFISTLDNDSATYSSGFYFGSLISGTETAAVSIPVPEAGSHFIEIGYRKDGSQTSGSDCAWFKVVE